MLQLTQRVGLVVRVQRDFDDDFAIADRRLASEKHPREGPASQLFFELKTEKLFAACGPMLQITKNRWIVV